MKSSTYLSLVTLGFSASLALGPVALAGDCGQDPVYSKNLIGAPTVGLRVRDIACMEGSKVLTVVSAGTNVQIIAETDGWYKVKIGNTVGWMGSALMTVKGEGSASVKTETKVEKIEVKDAVKVELGKKLLVGIAEKDFEKLKKDKVLQSRLKDKVVMRVQKKGETWYVEKDGVLTQVKMYGKNEFKRLSGEKKVVVEKKEEKSLPPAGIISLAAKADAGVVKLMWEANVSAPNGFKIVKSSEPNPTYPGDDAQYIEANRFNHVWKVEGGKTYHFRVCRYTGNGCDSYSNDVAVTVPESVAKETGYGYNKIDGEIVLKASTLPGAVSLEWTKRTSSGFQGYKVVRSESDADLAYPKSGYVEFLSDRDSLYFIDGTATPGKTYYYRICTLEEGSNPTCGNVIKVTARQR